MERIQGTQVLWKIMAAINLGVPIHREVFVACQARKPHGAIFQLPLQVGQGQPGVENGHGGGGFELLDLVKPLIELFRSEVHGKMIRKFQVRRLQPGYGV